MANLTVSEARTRAGLVVVHGYDVSLDLDRGPETFGSHTRIRFGARHDADTFVELRAEELHAATLDGESLDPSTWDDGRLRLTVSAGDHELVVESTMRYSNDGEGMHRAVDPVDDEAYLYAMSFLDAAPRIFCCFDQPDLKAPYTFTVRTPAHWTVLGNARAERTADGAWRLAQDKPLSTYFVTLVAGPYHVVTREHDGIRMGLVTRGSLAPALDKDVDELFTVTAQCFDAYHEMFGVRYPFGDYYQCFVPEFNAGAMENPGCVTFRDDMVFRSRVTDAERGNRARVIAHEMAHQWFGDLVTMRWWDDLWLNESFAEYMAYRVCQTATDFQDGWVDFASLRKPWGLRADQRPSTHPVAGNGAADGASALSDFDGISYAKGASVLKQLAARLGDDVFLGGVRKHLTAHAFGNATLDDLFAAWRDAGAQGLDGWTDAWLRTAGPDTIGSDRSSLRLVDPGPTRRPHTFSVGVVERSGDVAVRQVTLDGDDVELDPPPADDALVLLDVHDDTWARFRHDTTTLELLTRRWPQIADPVTRASLWLGLRDAVEGAEVLPEYLVGALAGALPYEDQDTTLLALAVWAEDRLLGRFVTEPRAARSQLAGSYAERLATAAPSSAVQLAAARGLIMLTDDTRMLLGWLTGEVPDGLVVDDELRWRIVTQLARWGALSGDDIDRELERDPSSAGRIHATRARASRPDADAKHRAWQAMTRDAELSNYELYATAEGFWRREQARVFAPYVERYFTDFPRTQSFRSGWVVAQSAALAFPACVVDETVARAARATLERTDLAPGLRRSLADASADLDAALRVRRPQE